MTGERGEIVSLKSKPLDRGYSELSEQDQTASSHRSLASILMAYLIVLAVASELFAIAILFIDPSPPDRKDLLISFTPALFLAIATGLWLMFPQPQSGQLRQLNSVAKSTRLEEVRRFLTILGIDRRKIAWELVFAYFIATWLIELSAGILLTGEVAFNRIPYLALTTAAITVASLALAFRFMNSLSTAIQGSLALYLSMNLVIYLFTFPVSSLDIHFLFHFLISAILPLALPLFTLRFFDALPLGLPIAFGGQALIAGLTMEPSLTTKFFFDFGRHMVISAAVVAAYSWFFSVRLRCLESDQRPFKLQENKGPANKSNDSQPLGPTLSNLEQDGSGPLLNESQVRSSKARKIVYLCYSRDDDRWLDRIKKMLHPLIEHCHLEFWNDSKIALGSERLLEIERAIEEASVALLLVSENFLASDFIKQIELPKLLQKRDEGKLHLLWVLLTSSLYEQSPLSKFKAAHDTSIPLDMLTRPKRNKVLKEVGEQILKLMKD